MTLNTMFSTAKSGIFFLVVTLFFACNPDTAGVKSDTPSPVIAPASAPPNRASNQATATGELRRDAPKLEQAAGLPAGETATAPPANDPYAIKKMGPGKMKPQTNGGGEQRSTQPAPATASREPVKPTQRRGTPSLEGTVSNITAPLVFEVRKTPCNGDCEQYSLRLHDGGLLVYNGKDNTPRRGFHTREMMTFKYKNLVKAFRDLDVQNLAEFYPENPNDVYPDAPSTILEFPAKDGELKKITIQSAAPQALQDFLDEVETLTRFGVWAAAKE